MKNIFLLSIATILLLAGCTSSDEATTGDGAFSIYAPVSRTTNSGSNTLWAMGDAINILHAEAEGYNYVTDGAFQLKDISTGRFVGTLGEKLSSGASYDWYASYPYTTPLSAPNGAFVIGNTAGASQIQSGNNSSAHMAGEHMPLVGKASAVAAERAPMLTMKNAASAAKFVIHNALDESITIKSIELTAPNHNLTGSFNIDFANTSKISYTPIETSDKATLEVVDGESIASAGEASFYMAIAPFAAVIGEHLTFKVTLLTSQGERSIEKTHTLTSELTFTAGKTKEITLNCGEELKVVKLPLNELPPLASEESQLRLRILCYNIRNCKGSDGVTDYQRVADVISRCNVDVVALQEVDSMTTRHPGIDVSKKLGDLTGHYATYGAAIKYTTGKYGVAVLSKEKPKSWRTVKLPCSSEERVLLIVEFESYYFCSTHFSLYEEYRLKAVDIIAEEVSKLNKPVFIAGDLNATPDSSVLSALRLNFEIFEKVGSPLTFPASAPNREIDYVGMSKMSLYYPIIYEHYVVNAPVESDHRPILADVEVFKSR